MTIEEKAKAYDEALERAKAYHRNELAGSRKEMTEYIFPELRESEDERIRKEIIEHIKDQMDSFISAPDCRDKYEEEELTRYKSWIDWLEKQKEQKPIGTDFCTAVKNLMNLHKIKNEFTEEDYDFQAKELLKLIKQKPAEWSEEDEFRLKEALEVLDESIRHLPIGCGYLTDVMNVTKWLKSLRPSWKPSERQMKALEQAIVRSYPYEAPLFELYKQLKKL